jgi:hypothetical protein
MKAPSVLRSRARRSGLSAPLLQDNGSRIIVNRTKFHEPLKEESQIYHAELRDPVNRTLRGKFPDEDELRAANDCAWAPRERIMSVRCAGDVSASRSRWHWCCSWPAHRH